MGGTVISCGLLAVWVGSAIQLIINVNRMSAMRGFRRDIVVVYVRKITFSPELVDLMGEIGRFLFHDLY